MPQSSTSRGFYEGLKCFSFPFLLFLSWEFKLNISIIHVNLNNNHKCSIVLSRLVKFTSIHYFSLSSLYLSYRAISLSLFLSLIFSCLLYLFFIFSLISSNFLDLFYLKKEKKNSIKLKLTKPANFITTRLTMFN